MLPLAGIDLVIRLLIHVLAASSPIRGYNQYGSDHHAGC